MIKADLGPGLYGVRLYTVFLVDFLADFSRFSD